MSMHGWMQDRRKCAKPAPGSPARPLLAGWGRMAAAAVLISSLVLVPKSSAQQSSQEGPSGVVPSSRTSFSSLCGIRDTDVQSALHLARSKGGKWAAIASDKRPAAGNDMAARVWHEKNWMVDLHDTPAPTVPVIHTGQMCFDPQGRLTRMVDRYMELAECRCMRFTSLTFAPDGTVKEQEQKFVDQMSGTEMAKPDAAKGFPSIWEYRRLEQLPFYSLLRPSTPTAGAPGTPKKK